MLDIDEEEEVDADVVEERKKMGEESEDQFKLEIANLFGKVFLSHKEKSMGLFDYLYKNHIVPSLSSGTLINIEYGLFLVVDAIEHIGQFLTPQVLNQFFKYLFTYAQYNNYEINQSSIFGINLISKVLPPQDYKVLFGEVYPVISSFLTKEKQKIAGAQNYKSCRDNFVSTLGNSLQALWFLINDAEKQLVFEQWVKELPLVTDKTEALQQHKLLANFVQSQSGFVFGPQFEHLERIINIYHQIYEKKKISDQTLNQQIKTQLTELFKLQPVQAKLNALQLSINLQKFIRLFVAQ